MQKLFNRVMRRKQSTQRVDDMASMIARTALDQRVNKMLASQLALPLPQVNHFKPLINPIQNPPKS